MATGAGLRSEGMTLGEKLWRVNWSLVLLLCLTAAIGFAMLYSAANGRWDPWASRQAMRFGAGLGLLFLAALIHIRLWLRYAYIVYGASFVLLVAVELAGVIGMGATRWINLGFFQFQPSEVMKIALVLALARYFHAVALEDVNRPRHLVVPLLLILAPAAMVLRQPDLGTALMLVMIGGAVLVTTGIRLWKFALAGGAALAAIPVAWQFLRGYQKQRVLTFLNPETDPLGAGYHIIQSKIALGSGGLVGKGFLQGTQSHLNFLPEKQTDFIFTMLAEEFGLFGGLGLLGLYALIIGWGIAIALRSRSQFGRLLAMGVTSTFFLYVFINIAMVMGLIPVVGVPLPLISYGGTAMLSLMLGFGLVVCVFVHRDVQLGKQGGLP